LPVLLDPQLSPEVEALATRIAGATGDLDAARRVAEAQIDLTRVRLARQALLSAAPNEPGHADPMAERVEKRLRRLYSRTMKPAKADWIDRFDAWVRSCGLESDLKVIHVARATRKAIREADVHDRAEIAAALASTEALARLPRSAPEHEARQLRTLTKELALLERYERRAISRRKQAIRDFDGMQVEGARI
jgi:hypothetical protein